MKTESFKSNTN
nr:unnamed protein product [Callosobruchus analis]